MRSALVAVAVAVFVVVTLARAGLASAEPPPPMEEREIKKVIEALKKEPARKSSLASVRFYAEVLGGESVRAPVGSPLTTLGPWGDDGARLAAEAVIASSACGSRAGTQQKAALSLLTEYRQELAPSLRGFALLEQGKGEDAAKIFGAMIDGALPEAECPSEHPMYSHRRVAMITMALSCLERAAPGGNRSAFTRRLEKARSCASNNHAVV